MDTDNILACLERIEKLLSSDDYENGSVVTIGGGSGNYMVKSPYNTECEFTVLGAFATTGAGIVVLSSSNSSLSLPSLTGTTSYGLVSAGGEGNNVFEGYVLPISSTQSPVLIDHWQPLGKGVYIYANISTAVNTSAFVMVAFRRKLDRAIPNAPLRKPHTHSQPTSRRGNRNFMQGFEAQYPHDKYVHEEIPETQDTAMNVENAPTPAQTLLARMRDAQGGRR